MHFYLQKYQVTVGFLLPYALYVFAILKISRSETKNFTFQSNFCFTLIPVFAADRNFEQYTTRFLLVHTILSLMHFPRPIASQASCSRPGLRQTLT